MVMIQQPGCSAAGTKRTPLLDDLIQELVYGFSVCGHTSTSMRAGERKTRASYALAAAAARAAARRRARIAAASGAPMTTVSTWRQKAGSPDVCRISLRKG